MGIQHIAFNAGQRGARGGQLGQHIHAITPVFNHAGNAAHLAFHPFQPGQLRPMIGMAGGGVGGSGMAIGHALQIPHGGIFDKRQPLRQGLAMHRPFFLLAALVAHAASAQTAAPQAEAPTYDHAAMGHEQMDHSKMDHAAMGHDMAGMGMMAMPAAFGPYSMTREASGTAWQPDASPMLGVYKQSGGWTLMGFSILNGVANHQSGPRGDSKAYLAGVVMGMATKPVSARDTIQLRLMLSPDPLMGPRGYPLLLAAGETADGRTLLVDRQHPHDLFMEMAVAGHHRIGKQASLFLYAGLPGEPAFGPGTYMHRLSILDMPEAPISHHWLDSTHIVFGVVTAGVIWRGLKLEASRFKGREPDQRRWNIEAPRLDSTAVRLSWNPLATLALQASWARQQSPEALEPLANATRLSASAIYTKPIGSKGGFWSTTLAWGRKSKALPGQPGDPHDALLLETGWVPNPQWRLFLRAEQVASDELLPTPGQISGPEFTVRKLAAAVIRDVTVAKGVKLGLGAQLSASFVPAGLAASYGGNTRLGGMLFARMRLG